jgi:hypothetical protein
MGAKKSFKNVPAYCGSACSGYAIKMDMDFLSASCEELHNGWNPLKNLKFKSTSHRQQAVDY